MARPRRFEATTPIKDYPEAIVIALERTTCIASEIQHGLGERLEVHNAKTHLTCLLDYLHENGVKIDTGSPIQDFLVEIRNLSLRERHQCFNARMIADLRKQALASVKTGIRRKKTDDTIRNICEIYPR